MVDKEDLQEKILFYRVLESKLETLVKQRELVGNKINELVSTVHSIEEADKSDGEIVFKFSDEAYTFAKIVDKNKILVEIGAGVSLEKTMEDAKGILNGRRDELEKSFAEIQNNLSQISNAINKLAPEINSMIEKSQDEGSVAG